MDPLPVDAVANAIDEVFGDEPITDVVLLKAIKAGQYEQLAKELNDRLASDRCDADMVFESLMDAEIIVRRRQDDKAGQKPKKERPYEEAIRNPDFNWVENHLGATIPKTLKIAYTSGELLELDHIVVDEEDPEIYFSITYFHRQDEDGYQQVWPGTEGMLILADDGAGNVYFAKPSEKFKHVYFYDHETAERSRIGVSVPGFIKKLREHKPDHD